MGKRGRLTRGNYGIGHYGGRCMRQIAPGVKCERPFAHDGACLANIRIFRDPDGEIFVQQENKRHSWGGGDDAECRKMDQNCA
jgi:hypothetical protein